MFKSVCIVKRLGWSNSAGHFGTSNLRIFLSVAAACTLCTPRGRGTLDLFAFFSPSFINPWPQPWRTSRGIRKRRARKINLAEYSYGSAVNIPTTINSGLPSWIPRSTLLLSFFFARFHLTFFFLSFFFISFCFSSSYSLLTSLQMIFNIEAFNWISRARDEHDCCVTRNYTETDNEFRDTCRYSRVDGSVRVCLITPFRRVIDNVIIDFPEIRLVGLLE